VVIRHGGWSGHHHHPAFLRMLGINVQRGGHDDEDDPVAMYQEGKAELVELLLDQAGTLGKLPAGQWVVISAYVDDEVLRDEKGIRRLVLRVRTDDLKAYAEDKLEETAATAKIQVEES
jgi:hypothetical protein